MKSKISKMTAAFAATLLAICGVAAGLSTQAFADGVKSITISLTDISSTPEPWDGNYTIKLGGVEGIASVAAKDTYSEVSECPINADGTVIVPVGHIGKTETGPLFTISGLDDDAKITVEVEGSYIYGGVQNEDGSISTSEDVIGYLSDTVITKDTNLNGSGGNNVPLAKTINASQAVDTSDIVYTFAVSPLPKDETALSSQDATVAPIPTVKLAAGKMDADEKVLASVINLPNTSDFSHPGVYSYIINETSSVSDDWANSQATYRLNLYVVRDEDNSGKLLRRFKYDETPYEIIRLTDDEGAEDGTKVDSVDFTNTYIKKTNLIVTKKTEGDYADKTQAFPFDITITLPSWAADQEVPFAATGEDPNGEAEDKVATTDRVVTISGVKLADGQTIEFTDLPVGSTYTVKETDSTAGVNEYAPTAVFHYAGEAADGEFAAKDNDLAVSDGVHEITAFVAQAEGVAVNETTTLGAGEDNAVTVTNTLDNPPSPTGILAHNAPYILLATAAISLIAIAIRRRNREDEI